MKKHLLFFLYALLPFLGKSQDYAINTNCSTPFEDISTIGFPLSLGYNQTVPTSLPFTFVFYDQSYNALQVSNNGGILFGANGIIPTTNTQLPSFFSTYNPPTIQQAGLFPHWGNIGVNTGNVYIAALGNSPNRRFIVQWQDRNLVGSSCLGCGITFQIVLYETSNNFAFVYKDLDVGSAAHNNGALATVGIQRNRYQGELLSFNNPAYLTGRTCLTFSKVEVNFGSFRYGVQCKAQ